MSTEFPPSLGRGFVRSILVLAGMVVAGFVSLYLAWHGTAHSAAIERQTPYVISGGFGGIALIGTGLGLLWVQSKRRLEWLERCQLAEVIIELRRIVEKKSTALASASVKGTQTDGPSAGDLG